MAIDADQFVYVSLYNLTASDPKERTKIVAFNASSIGLAQQPLDESLVVATGACPAIRLAVADESLISVTSCGDLVAYATPATTRA